MDLVKIEDEAIKQILSYAFGALSVESSGLLSGKVYQKNDRRTFVVQSACASQTAHRCCGSVTPNEREEGRIGSILNVIGGFHSHVGREAILGLSDGDKDYIKENYEDGLEIVTTVRRIPASHRIRTSPTHVSGCRVDKNRVYEISCGAFYLDFGKEGGKGRIRVAELDISKKILSDLF